MAGSMTLGEAVSRARIRGERMELASESARDGIAEEIEGDGSSVRVSSWSRADLQAETRWLCLRHATFLMILSRQGPSTLPHRVEPPRGCVDAIDE